MRSSPIVGAGICLPFFVAGCAVEYDTAAASYELAIAAANDCDAPMDFNADITAAQACAGHGGSSQARSTLDDMAFWAFCADGTTVGWGMNCGIAILGVGCIATDSSPVMPIIECGSGQPVTGLVSVTASAIVAGGGGASTTFVTEGGMAYCATDAGCVQPCD